MDIYVPYAGMKCIESFFPTETFEAIKSRLVQSELAEAPNALAADNFGAIGFCTSFEI